ncbi:MAG: S9 family peptidase [Deltaproteobacteria bacterium]|nr:S9 family peptidase [Deltaproteobacteria bacterium]
MRIHAFGMAIAVLLVSQATFAAPHPVTIDDVMRMRIITDLKANPAGQGVIIQVRRYEGGDSFKSDLWLARPGTAPVRLTLNGHGAGAYAWSPDGRSVAFVDEREDGTGIRLLSLGGGESSLLKALPVDVGNLRWVGGRIFFTAMVFPDCGADLECTRKRLDDRKDGPSGLVYDDLMYRQWNFWRDGRRSNLFALNTESGAVEVVASGAFDTPPIPFGGLTDYSVSPDGKAVAYTAKKVKDPAISTNDDIYEVVNGKVTRLTDNPAYDGNPVYSPDGKWIAYLSQEIPGFESDKVRLRLYDRSGGTSVTLAEGLDNWVTEMVWSRDSKELFLSVEEQGHRLLYRVAAVKGAKPMRMSGRYTDRRLALSGDGRVLYITRETMVDPPDVYGLELGQKMRIKETRLTNLNASALADIAMPKVEEVWYDGAKGEDGKRHRVHAFLAHPPLAKAGVKYPLVVMIHGGPQGAWHAAFHPRWTALGIAGHGFAVLMPNPTGSTGYGQDFINAVSKDWGGRCYEDIMALMDYAKKLKGVDADRACAMGGSFGGYMANWIEGHTDRFKCLISHAGVSNVASMYGSTDELWFPEWDVGGTPWGNPDAYKRWSPVNYAENFRTPMLVIHGQNDFRVPLEQGLNMFQLLRRLNVEAKLLYFPDESHFVSKPKNRAQWYGTVVEWLKKHLEP